MSEDVTLPPVCHIDLLRATTGLNGKPTLGSMSFGDQFCVTLERSANGDHPCISAGEYDVVEDWHHPLDLEKRYRVPELRGVPGRSDIQIHIANRVDQLLGCIAPGERVSEDGLSVEESGSAFRRIKGAITYPCRIRIYDPT